MTAADVAPKFSPPIPLDEDHRFLDWERKPTRDGVMGWQQWFTRRGVGHETHERSVALNPREGIGWTIYKHMWNNEIGRFCCGSEA